ncbi:MAG: hypothetical protein J6N72_06885 [Psychrobacter sp.]|nr:hypothetical protein [Psychrobacter sp.]
MADNSFNATVSDLAASILAETVIEAAKSDNPSDIPVEAIERINPSMLIGSMMTDDPVKSNQIKPTLILNDKQKNNLKNSFLLIKDHIKLSLADEAVDNKFYSNAISNAKEKQLNVHHENSRLISLNAITAVKTRQRLESGERTDGSSDEGKEVKIPDELKHQISRLNHAISSHPHTSAINIGLALGDFWSGFTRLSSENDIEGELDNMFNATSESAAERIKKATESKLEELRADKIGLEQSNNKAAISDRYQLPSITQSQDASIEDKKPSQISENSETHNVSP